MLRRAFLSGAHALGGLFAIGGQSAPAQSTGPRMHTQDDWLDRAPRGHRVVFDVWMADKVGETFGFASNWVRHNKEAYGLSDSDLGVVIVARHGSTPFAFNEAMWTKYGKIFGQYMSTNDKERHPNPTTNTYARQIGNLVSQGMRFAICNLTTRAYADIIARETRAEQPAVLKELTENAVGDAHFFAAGIVAVTRAQERGYSYVSIG